MYRYTVIKAILTLDCEMVPMANLIHILHSIGYIFIFNDRNILNNNENYIYLKCSIVNKGH